MPWLAVEKDYAFEDPNGPASFADLLDRRRQLLVYLAFYAPDFTTAWTTTDSGLVAVGCVEIVEIYEIAGSGRGKFHRA